MQQSERDFTSRTGDGPEGDGFTLIELSIVLVIIGLIVGGVLAGRYLIRASELQSIITDEQKYITAVNTFRTKYNELPGDMSDATNFWGTDPAGCPDDTPVTAPQTKTCNGNGNGLIENDGTGETGDVNQYENFRAWQQLANNGLVPGAYTGINGPANWTDNEPGLNVPQSKLPGAGFEWVAFNANARYSASFWSAQYNVQYLMFGSSSALIPNLDAQTDLIQPVLSPLDAQALDLKVDDGNPTTGTILASLNMQSELCTTPTWLQPISYNISVGGPQCNLLLMVKSW